MNNQKGFSITEVLIAMGLLGVLSFGIMKIIESSTKAQKNIEHKDSISQLHREINDVLSNPLNCGSSFLSKSEGAQIPMIYQLQSQAGVVPKFVVGETYSKIILDDIRLKSLDMNGSDGSLAIATVEVKYKKSGSFFGGSEIKKEIKINANTCVRYILENPSIQTLAAACSGNGKRIIEGPHSWNGQNWIACQECNGASPATIKSCQSPGFSGIDVGNVTELSCLSLGGVYDDETARCLFNGVTLDQLIQTVAQTKVNEFSQTLPGSILNTTPPTGCATDAVYSLTVVNGKITMTCSNPAPVACTGCASWGQWEKYSGSPICDGSHSGVKNYRVNCHYRRNCAVKSPAGCTGSVAQDTKYTWCSADSYPNCGKWDKAKNCEEDGPAQCPGSPWW